jgi:hypothetical protein
MLRVTLLCTAVLVLAGCEPEVLTSARLSVPDVEDWTCSVEQFTDFSTNEQDYTRNEPDVEWSYLPDPDGNTRVRGFCQFQLDSFAISPDRVRACTLSYYVTDMDAAAPADIRHVALDVATTPESELYLDGADHAVVAMDSSPALGWRHLNLNNDGVVALKENLRLDVGRIGYCWNVQGGSERGAIAAGHDDSLRPYLTIVYADTLH